MKILIVEDEPLACQMLQLALEELGHSVVACADGEEAWATYQREECPLIVSDWTMPKLDGLELCKRIRQAKSKKYCYFIILTANEGTENYHTAMGAGVDDFLNKPLNLKELEIRLKVAERILGFKAEIEALKEVIPFCSYCKKVRKDNDYWERLEIFLEKNLNKDISHSICPDCFRDVVEPQLED